VLVLAPRLYKPKPTFRSRAAGAGRPRAGALNLGVAGKILYHATLMAVQFALYKLKSSDYSQQQHCCPDDKNVGVIEKAIQIPPFFGRASAACFFLGHR